MYNFFAKTIVIKTKAEGLLPPLNDERLMLIEKRFAGFYPHTKLMFIQSIDKSPRVMGSSFSIYAQKPNQPQKSCEITSRSKN